MTTNLNFELRRLGAAGTVGERGRGPTSMPVELSPDLARGKARLGHATPVRRTMADIISRGRWRHDRGPLAGLVIGATERGAVRTPRSGHLEVRRCPTSPVARIASM